MKLTRLTIDRLPGIEPGFELKDLAPGLNLITGPNAVGKSSLIRALEYLVGGVHADDPRSLVLDAEFDNRTRWRVQRTASHLQWERDGVAVEQGPSLPGRDELHCYWLKVEDLLADDAGKDETLVAAIRKALAGGFNLPALRSGEFDYGRGRGQKEARELQAAVKALRQAEAANQALQQDEQGLASLQDEIKAARRAERERRQLSEALNLEATLEERRQREAVLADFPADMDKLRGDEGDRLAELDKRLAGLQEEQLGIREQRAAARRALADTGLEGPRPARHELQAVGEKLGRLRELAREQAHREDEATRLAAREETARRALQGEEGALPEPTMSLETVEQAYPLAAQLRERELEIQRLDARIQAAGEAPDTRAMDRHREAIAALHRWLNVESGQGRPWWSGGLALAAGFGTGVGAILHGVWWLLLPAGLALAAAGMLLARPVVGRAADAQSQFRQTGVSPPEAWSSEAVAARLRALESDWGDLQLARQRAEGVSEDRAERARLQQSLQALQSEKTELAKTLGFDPALTAAGLHFFAKVLEDWLRADGALAEVRALIKDLQAQCDAGLAEVQAQLQQWGMPVEADLDTLDAALRDLSARCERADAAERDLAAAGDRETQLLRQLEERGQERQAILERAGLPEAGAAAESALRERLERLAEWRESQESLRGLERRETELRQLLAEAPECRRQAEAGEREALQGALARAEQEAEQLEARLREDSAIRERLKSAGRDQALERAMAAETQAETALAEQRDRAMLAQAGQFLLDEVESEYQSEHEPDVLRDARELFRRFTHQNFDLAPVDETGLMAEDARLGARRPLSELSSGTRMQLLLAVRLAWTRRLETQCEPLPVFLDEALTTSDEQRFQAVAESLAALAEEEGRQIFYLSARRQELGMWERLSGLRPHHVDLAALRFGQSNTTPKDYVVPPSEQLPSVAGESAESWAAKAGIPPVKPRQHPGTLSLFHLLRDELPLLEALGRQYAVHTLGQLEQLLDSNVAADAIPDADQRRRLGLRCEAARAWFRAWRHGRGQPVDRGALEASGAVSDNYIDAVSELAEALEGDGQRLLEKLEEEPLPSSTGGNPRRLSKGKREELAGWLEEQGYVSREQPLAADERLRRTLWAVAGEEDARHVAEWLEASVNQSTTSGGSGR